MDESRRKNIRSYDAESVVKNYLEDSPSGKRKKTTFLLDFTGVYLRLLT